MSHLVALLVACPALRDLSLSLASWNVIEEVPGLLLHTPHLESLSLLNGSGLQYGRCPEPPELLAAFAASTTLRHLHLDIHLTPDVFASLSTSLTSLTSLKTRRIARRFEIRMNRRNSRGSRSRGSDSSSDSDSSDDSPWGHFPPLSWVPETLTLQAIIASKGKPLLPRLERFTLTHCTRKTPAEPEVLALIEEAKGVELEIEIGAEARPGSDSSDEDEDEGDAEEAEGGGERGRRRGRGFVMSMYVTSGSSCGRTWQCTRKEPRIHRSTSRPSGSLPPKTKRASRASKERSIRVGRNRGVLHIGIREPCGRNPRAGALACGGVD